MKLSRNFQLSLKTQYCQWVSLNTLLHSTSTSPIETLINIQDRQIKTGFCITDDEHGGLHSCVCLMTHQLLSALSSLFASRIHFLGSFVQRPVGFEGLENGFRAGDYFVREICH